MIRTAIALLVLGYAASHSLVGYVHADENMGEKVEGKMGDMKTDSKKSVRKMKRHHRKAHGTDNVAKDARDHAQDAGDDMKNTADKTKNKID